MIVKDEAIMFPEAMMNYFMHWFTGELLPPPKNGVAQMHLRVCDGVCYRYTLEIPTWHILHTVPICSAFGPTQKLTNMFVWSVALFSL